MARSLNERFNIDVLSDRLSKLISNATDLSEAMREGADYMVRSTQNRILRQKVSPSGKVWDMNGPATISIKGFNSPLFRTGALADGIRAQRVTRNGFTIASTARSGDGTDYGALMQKGIPKYKMRGMIKKRRVPARPFLGFSQENIRRLSQILKTHLTG